MPNQVAGGQLPMDTPPIVSPQEWEAAREQLLVKEKALTRARDALAAERRRMPWLAVEKDYAFDGPEGKVSLLDLFDGRRQLIVYRAFFEPGVHGWPEHACLGCSLGADQVSHLAHLNARDTTLVYASRAPQADIARLKARMGWTMPWYTITDSFDKDFGVDEWHGHNAFIRDGDALVPHLLHQQPRRRGDGHHLELPRHDGARAPGGVGGLAKRLPADPAVQVVELARRIFRQRRARQEMGRGVGCRTGGVGNATTRSPWERAADALTRETAAPSGPMRGQKNSTDVSKSIRLERSTLQENGAGSVGNGAERSRRAVMRSSGYDQFRLSLGDRRSRRPARLRGDRRHVFAAGFSSAHLAGYRVVGQRRLDRHDDRFHRHGPRQHGVGKYCRPLRAPPGRADRLNCPRRKPCPDEPGDIAHCVPAHLRSSCRRCDGGNLCADDRLRDRLVRHASQPCGLACFRRHGHGADDHGSIGGMARLHLRLENIAPHHCRPRRDPDDPGLLAGSPPACARRRQRRRRR